MKLIAPICLLLAASVASAQWSTDPSVNLVIGDRTGEQVQPKVVALPDGSSYISWLDNETGGYDTYLQRLDPAGNEQWAHNGILITDCHQSSTQDYGLSVDADGNALIAYRDDTTGVVQVGVQKVAPDGTRLWGPTGILVTNVASTVFIGNPKVAALSDGGVAVAWSQGSGYGIQKFTGAGVPLWGAGGVVSSPATGSYLMADVQPGDNGTAIALWVRATGGFSSPRYLWTQKFASANGAGLWNGGTPLALYDGSSVQNGYFPPFQPDGQGGAVYGWYERGTNRYSLVQHISAAGVELYGHNGVPVNLTAGRDRLSPWMAYSPINDTIFMAWTETNVSNQNVWGLYAQKFIGGVRQWGDAGVEILPQTTNQNSFVRCVTSGDGVIVSWFEKSGSSKVQATKLNADGTNAWSPAIIDVTTISTSKGRLDMAPVNGGCAYLVWHDGRGTANDIIAQAVTADGALGACAGPPCPADFNQDGGVDGADVEAFFTVWSDGLPEADVNGDGGVDGADVQTFFEAWEAGGCN